MIITSLTTLLSDVEVHDNSMGLSFMCINKFFIPTMNTFLRNLLIPQNCIVKLA